MGGHDGSARTKLIEYFSASTGGSTTNFGDLFHTVWTAQGNSNEIRGIHGGGNSPSPGYSDTISYITIASEGDAIDFGDFTQNATGGITVTSSTRGVFAIGGQGGSYVNSIEYVEIMTLGNALDFGDLVTANWNITAASSPTRGFTFGGSPNNPRYVTVTIASKGNAIDFGGLAASVNSAMGCANPTRAVIMGGQNPTNIATMETIQMSSGGNFVIFGELTEVRSLGTGSATATRACSI